MNRYSWYSYLARYVILVAIFISIVLNNQDTPGKLVLYGGMALILIINEYLRYNYFYKYKNRLFSSIILSTAFSIIIQIFNGRYADFYFTALLYEVIIMLKGKRSRILLGAHVALFILLLIYSNIDGNLTSIGSIFSLSFLQNHGMGLITNISIYGSLVCMFFYIKLQTRERNEIYRLNEELKKSYKQLEEYSRSIEELSAARERDRVAQEMHDTLGHSLSALIMHLDFIEKLMDKDTKKAGELIIKVQDIARESMTKLRETVYALKHNDCPKEIIPSINELISNLTSAEALDVELKTVGDIETLSPRMKDVIFKTVRESLTNGIKHGDAERFKISISLVNNSLRINIWNNGKASSTVVPGNGLQGMMERINFLKGEIVFGNRPEGGFMVEAVIPIKEVSL